MPENLPHRAPSAVPMQAMDWTGELPDRLRDQLPIVQLNFYSYLGQNFIVVPKLPEVPSTLMHLRDREQFDMLTDLTAVDRPNDEKRFEIVYVVYSFARNARLRVKTRVTEGEAVLSAVTIYPAANWLEREVFDMFGVRFNGHPNLKRILMPDDWEGHPLRKDKSIIAMDEDWVHRNLGIESAQS